MKKILITGLNSYVGISLEKWLGKYRDKYSIDLISLRNDLWKEKDFSEYDVLFHVAALVHKKEQSQSEKLYYKINCDLTIELANKAKKAGIKQFIFMSTLSVYGFEGKVGKEVSINRRTQCKPITLYGKSKLKAEVELNKVANDDFNIVIIRAPMIYGKDSPGNYLRLRKLALITPVFPKIQNQRSMIFVDNLSEFIRLIIDNQESGLFFPQNHEYVNTNELVKLIAMEHKKRLFLSNLMGRGVKLLANMSTVNKVFGNLVISPELSNYLEFKYCVTDLKESIMKSEKKI